MTLISSSNSPTSSDHVSTIRSSLNFNYWMAVFNVNSFSIQNRTLFWQGLHDHPEWVNQTDRYQRTLLIKASECGHVEAAQALIQAGADLNHQDKEGWTALMWASLAGYTEIVQLLIDAGAHLNVQNKDGWTALITASRCGAKIIKALIIQALIKAGADLNVQDSKGYTALMYASEGGHSEVANLFIHQGARPEIKNHNLKTARDLAQIKGHDRIAHLLEAYASSQELNQVINPSYSSLKDISPSSSKTPRL